MSIAKAQDPVFKVINNFVGLPSNTVYDMLQDSLGFIWFAHDKGLSKYDGISFVHYKSNAAQGKAVSNLLHYRDRIYCQDFSGHFYEVRKDSLLLIEEIITTKGTYYPAVLDKNGNLVTWANNTICIFNAEKRDVTLKKDSYQNPHFLLTADGIKVYEDGKVFRLDGTTDQIFNNKPQKTPYIVRQIGNNLYGFTKNEYPYVYKLQNNCAAIELSKSSLFIQEVNIVGNELWICTSTGAYCFDENLQPKYDGFCFFNGTSISCATKDREGNYWFTTLDKGVLFVANLSIRKYAYNNESFTTMTVNPNDQSVLLGTNKGEILKFGADFSFRQVYKSKVNSEVLGINSLGNKFYMHSDKLLALNADFKEIWSNHIATKHVTEITDGNIVVAFTSGLALVSSNRKKVRVPKWLENEKNEWLNEKTGYLILEEASRGRSVVFDSKDSILYGATSSGLHYFSPKSKGTITLNSRPIFASQLKVQNGILFASTFQDGLLQISELNATQLLSVENGLFSNTIFKFQLDGDQIWLLEEGMIQCYNLKTKLVVNYSVTDGLPKAEVKDLLIVNDQVYLATTEGLVLFKKNEVVKSKIPPLISINACRVNGIEVALTNNLQFAANENNVDVYFSVLSFKGEDAVQVMFKLDKNEWLKVQKNSRSLSFNSLAYGNHVLQIQAINENGVACLNPAVFRFTIATPWYKHWATITLSILSIVFLTYTYFKRRIRQINKHNAEVEEKLKLEREVQKSLLASIKSQMNPHFLFNALNTIQSFIYTNDKETAALYLGKFSDLTRSILEMSNNETITLSEEIRTLHLYLELEKIRFDNSLHYEIEVTPDIQTDLIQIPSMLVQPYAENAIKHGLFHKVGDRNLHLKFTIESQNLCIRISDNGVGRARSAQINQLKYKQHQSFATKANQKRLDILNLGSKEDIVVRITDLYDKQQAPMGTQVDLYIPIFQKA